MRNKLNANDNPNRSVFNGNPNRSNFYESMEESFITDADIDVVMKDTRKIDRSVNSKFGIVREVLKNDFVKNGRLLQSEMDAIEEIHRLVSEDILKRGVKPTRKQYWQTAAKFQESSNFFGPSELTKMAKGNAPNWPGRSGDSLVDQKANIHHLEPKSVAPGKAEELQNLLPIPCKDHKWVHSSGSVVEQRFGFTNYVPCN